MATSSSNITQSGQHSSKGNAGVLQLNRNLYILELPSQIPDNDSNPFSPTDIPTTPALIDQKSSFRPQFKFAAAEILVPSRTRFPLDIVTKPSDSGSTRFLHCPLEMNKSESVYFHSKRDSSSSFTHFIDENSCNQSPNQSQFPFHYSRSPPSTSSYIDQTRHAEEFVPEISQESDERTLRRRGYSIIRKMSDTAQGCQYEAIMFEGHDGDGPSRVTIKKTIKAWHDGGVSVKDGTTVLTEENILKVQCIRVHRMDPMTNDSSLHTHLYMLEHSDYHYNSYTIHTTPSILPIIVHFTFSDGLLCTISLSLNALCQLRKR